MATSDTLPFALLKGTGLTPGRLPGGQFFHFANGTRLVFPAGLGFVLTGSVRVTRDNASTLLNILPAGGMFGVSTLFCGDSRPDTDLFAAGETDILFLPEGRVVTLLAGNGQVLENYLSFVSKRICFLNGKLGTFASQSAEDKILRHIAQNGGCVEIKSMTELAAMLSMGRASLYRGVEKLTETGRLRRDGHRLTLL